jgi:hypothetical protein
VTFGEGVTFGAGAAWALPAGRAVVAAVEPVGADPAGADEVEVASVASGAGAPVGVEPEADAPDAGVVGGVVESALVTGLAVGLDGSGTEEDDDASGSGVLAVIVVSLGATVERRYPVRSSRAGRVRWSRSP